MMSLSDKENPASPEVAGSGGVKRFPGCICDPVAYPDCPGHTSSGLRGLKSTTRPATTGEEGERHAKAVLRALRPRDTEERIQLLTARKTPWRAVAGFHWRGVEGLQMGKNNVAKRHMPTAQPYVSYKGDLAMLAATPRGEKRKERERPPPSTAMIEPTSPQLGQRVAVRDEPSGQWLAGTVHSVNMDIGGHASLGSTMKVYEILYDGAQICSTVRGDREIVPFTQDTNSYAHDTMVAPVPKRPRAQRAPAAPRLPPAQQHGLAHPHAQHMHQIAMGEAEHHLQSHHAPRQPTRPTPQRAPARQTTHLRMPVARQPPAHLPGLCRDHEQDELDLEQEDDIAQQLGPKRHRPQPFKAGTPPRGRGRGGKQSLQSSHSPYGGAFTQAAAKPAGGRGARGGGATKASAKQLAASRRQQQQMQAGYAQDTQGYAGQVTQQHFAQMAQFGAQPGFATQMAHHQQHFAGPSTDDARLRWATAPHFSQ